MYDRTDFKQVVAEKLRNVGILIAEAKKRNEEGILFPFYVPSDKAKHFTGFKGEVIAKLKEEGYHVTNFLPGVKPSFAGFIKEIYITWTDEGKQAGVALGYEFR